MIFWQKGFEDIEGNTLMDTRIALGTKVCKCQVWFTLGWKSAEWTQR